jgi:hypothetical protein
LIPKSPFLLAVFTLSLLLLVGSINDATKSEHKNPLIWVNKRENLQGSMRNARKKIHI